MVLDDDDFLSEKMLADMEQHMLEAEGRDFGRAMKRARMYVAVGKLAEAAEACPHGWGYPLNSEAALNLHDPSASQEGWRCLHCGSRLDSDVCDNPTVTVPCEIEGAF
jgi:hypothetical protein